MGPGTVSRLGMNEAEWKDDASYSGLSPHPPRHPCGNAGMGTKLAATQAAGQGELLQVISVSPRCWQQARSWLKLN